MNPVQFLLHALILAQSTAGYRLTTNLTAITEDLPKVRARSAQRATLEHVTATIAAVADRHARGETGFGSVTKLREAMVYLSGIEAPVQRHAPDGPLYNVTIWLAEAIADATDVARTSDILQGARNVGIGE